MKSRGVPAPAGSSTGKKLEAEEREGPNTVGSPAATCSFTTGADTAVSIEREVVSGHAVAILAPQAADGGRCGYDKPASLSVNGVFDP
jgi:hypothetical protein